jgi:hypothetical protein
MTEKLQLQIGRCCGTSAGLPLFRYQAPVLKTAARMEDLNFRILLCRLTRSNAHGSAKNAPCADARRFSGPCSMKTLARRNAGMILRVLQRVEANLLLLATDAVSILDYCLLLD